jgi:ribonuclease III
MNAVERLIAQSSKIEEKINYTFKDKELLALAMIHRSFINENKSVAEQHNERLEFLGDSILCILISEYLYVTFPTISEGDLSHLRSRLVEAAPCCRYVSKLCIESFLLLGKGEKRNGNRGRESILADLFEALIGAIFLDNGLEAAKSFFFSNFIDDIQEILKKPLRNWKAELQDYSQKKHQEAPIYETLEEIGPDHDKTFAVAVFINGQKVGFGQGGSKKEAQQIAAENGFKKLLEIDQCNEN